MHSLCAGQSQAMHTSGVVESSASVDESSQFVVCGAGAGGLAVAARLGRRFGEGRVTIVDPAEVCTFTGDDIMLVSQATPSSVWFC